jgi:hypothetical protein
MVIKQDFELLKDIPNLLSLSASSIKEVRIDNGPRKVFVVLKLMENKIKHFTKDKIIDTLGILEKRKMYDVVNLPDYSLHVSYNKPTKQMIINLSPFNTDDIYPNNPDPKNIYALMVYAICFHTLITEKVEIPEKHFAVISSFLTSMFVQVFGREFGLLGAYSNEISKLKFLIASYILTSFFGEDQNKSFRKAAVVSGINLKNIQEDLEKGNYNLNNIFDFVKALSDLKVMPGITKYSFTKKLYSFIGPSFLPGLEDLSRFISIITTSSISGSNVVNTMLHRYNKDDYIQLLEISKIVFK